MTENHTDREKDLAAVISIEGDVSSENGEWYPGTDYKMNAIDSSGKLKSPGTGSRDSDSSGAATTKRQYNDRDESSNSESGSFRAEKPPVLSRADRMRLSGRLVSDSEYARLSAFTGQHQKKKKQSLSKEEIALRRSETARKRKAQAHMRAEEVKINTIHKLLRRQASRKCAAVRDDTEANAEKRSVPPAIRYLYSKSGIFLSIPPASLERANLSFEVICQDGYAEPPRCSLEGCRAGKIYEHPSSGLRACCLEHYKIVSKS